VAWTGWAIIPDEPLVVKVVEGGEFIIHSCFQEMEIPNEYSKDEVFDKMSLVLEFGAVGFGTV
jgi:hypothetical protein